MAVKACSTKTLFQNIDIIGTTYYYKLVNNLTTPNVPADSVVDPTTSAGGNWSTSEPSYTEGSTSYLYYTIQTKFSNGTQSYSYSSIVNNERKACLSSSYEAAKAAYNKAVNAQSTANTANTNAEDALNTVNNIQIGGRNILLKTKTFSNENISSSTTGYLRSKGTVTTAQTIEDFTVVMRPNNNNGIIGEWLINDCKNSEEYTLSFWVRGTDKPRCYFYGPSGYIQVASTTTQNGSGVGSSDGNSDSVGGVPVSNTEWKRVWITWKLNDTGGTSTTKYALIRNDNNANVYVAGVKFEKGNKATDWTPAPEDVENDINETTELITDFTTNVDTANENLWFNYQKPKADDTQWTASPTEVIETGLPNNNEYSFALRINGITSYYVPYDKNKKYKIIGWLKTISSQASSTTPYYPSILPYDFDKNLISWNNMMSSPTSNTTLARDLKNGDTKVYITSTSNWPTGTSNKNYYVGVFDYKSSKGYSYETYTRHAYKFAASGDNLNNIINTTNKTVTLKSAYSGTTIPAGTTVSCTCDGSTYIYPWSGIRYIDTANWIYKESIFDSNLDIRLKEASYIRFYTYNSNVYYYGLSLRDYTADAAKEAASAAQSTANAAQSTANAAQSTATSAQTAANQAQTAADEAKSDATSAQSTANQAQSTANKAKTDVENMKSYIKFHEHYTDATHNDVACIEIVAPTAGSTMSIRILPDKIGFYTGQNETAYLSNNALYISESTILKKEKIGHWETVEDSLGNLNTKWVE